jgi:SAM-dependent methyltransferase
LQRSISFKWNADDFNDFLKSCETDPAKEYILKYMPKEGTILEAGCGLARFVQYLNDKGFERVLGIEINPEAVMAVKALKPNLDLMCGDVSQLSFADNSIDGIISLGVVEHFVEGPERPLQEMLRVLKPGGYAVITVPSFNKIRKMRYILSGRNLGSCIKKSASKILIRESSNYGTTRDRCSLETYEYRFKPWFVSGHFFEYRFTRGEFQRELTKVGFLLVDAVPSGQLDGIYMEFSPVFASFKKIHKFYPNIVGRLLHQLLLLVNSLLARIPFMSNHMLLCVVRKRWSEPDENSALIK